MRIPYGIAILLVILLSACSAASPAGDATVPPVTEVAATEPATAMPLVDIDVCYSAPAATQAVLWYAHEKGVLERYGIRANVIRVQGGANAMTALLSGDAALCQLAGSSVINAVAAGQDAVIVAGIYNTYPAVLVARPEIATVDDLRGQVIGTGLTASASEVATRLALEEMGLNPDTDVVLVEIGEEPDRVAAFRAQQVDAILTAPPYLHILRDEGVAELFDFGKIGLPYAHTGVVTTRAYVEANRPIVLNFIRAMAESIALMKQDPEGTKEVMAKYLELDPVVNADDLQDSYENVILPLAQDIPYPSLDGLQAVIRIAALSNPDAANIQPEQLVDLSIVQELEDEGFFDEILNP